MAYVTSTSVALEKAMVLNLLLAESVGVVQFLVTMALRASDTAQVCSSNNIQKTETSLLIFCLGSLGKARPLTSQLKTTFVPDDIHNFKSGPSTDYIRIRFKRTTCQCDEKTGQPFVTEQDEWEDGRIAMEPIDLPTRDRGRTKDVYMVRP